MEQHWISTYEKFAKIIYEVDADVYQNKKLTKQEVDIVLSLLPDNFEFDKKEDFILDLACGPGRHSLEFLKRGFNVIGLDYSKNFLKIAKEKVKEAKIKNKFKFLQGDIRSLPFKNQTFKFVTLLGNSFGYFSDRENKKILKEVYRILRKGGVFIFDTVDKNTFLKNLKPYSKYVIKTKNFGKVIDERWREYDKKTKTIKCRKKHSTIDGKILLDTPYWMKVYSQKEIKNMLKKVGFNNIKVLNLKGKDNLGLMQYRIFIRCQK